jgi:hypothetical protein
MNVQFRPLHGEPFAAKKAPAAPSTKISGAFTKRDHDTEFYNREIPTRFSSGKDDLLMRNLI